MKYFIAKSLKDKDYILMDENFNYCWDISMKNLFSKYNKFNRAGNGIYQNIDEWLNDIDKNGMILIAVYEEDTDVTEQYPEYFV